MTKRGKKIIEYVFYVAAVLILLWFVGSYIDVIRHNQPWQSGYGKYAFWNIIAILCN